ncbi:DNA mismatch repair protein PMS1 [Macadamia integrifolia]|uniref:DNA mismatch repair protein PMS1 n=1 Tax=Macadamia integrifolia TaxID=60698 RepID=UPI001C4E5B65|nr:DNA mismatch repair protein PMS1 [Macadamia integrifolia]
MEGTTVNSAAIKPINKSVVHRICSGQVILDLSSAVKELVENSLDAGATSIEIVLKDYGEESFKVIDNGCGISPSNFKVLALKHHTSKINDFPDLQSLTTFGFRGEALSSLCALGNLTVETRTKNEPVATHLTFDRSGLLISERKTARQIGTTVTVDKLFSTLPVRSKEFSRNIRKEYGKLISLLNAYALIAGGVRLVCTNTTGKNTKSAVLKTQGNSSIRDNIITVFGMKTFSCLEPLSIQISESCMIEGFLSKPGHGSGRNLGDRQYFFVNGRPVDMPKVSKLLNELYKSSNSKQYPIAVMNFTVPTRAYDVNVTPDKRKIFFSDEGSLMHSLREAVEKIYSSSNCSYSINRFEEPEKEVGNYELNPSHVESNTSLQEIPPEGYSCKDVAFCEREIMEEETTENDIPIKVVKKDIQVSYKRSGMVHIKDQSPIEKDFSLRVHAVEKADSSGNSNMPLSTKPHSTVDKHVPSPSRAVGKDSVGNLCSSSHSSIIQSSLMKFVTVNKRKHEDNSTELSEVPVLRNEPSRCQVRKSHSEMHASSSRSHGSPPKINDSNGAIENEPSEYHKKSIVCDEVPTPVSSRDGVYMLGSGREDLKDQEKVLPLDVAANVLPGDGLESILEDLPDTVSVLQSSHLVLDTPVGSSGLEICSTLHFSVEDLKTRRKQQSRMKSSGLAEERLRVKSSRCYAAATLEHSQPESDERKARALSAATTELERFFNKKDFSRMKVIGQFNLGFIIGRIDEDLFIVDQHAADEKYNFERLSQSTILNQQPLLQPMRLELSPEEEVVASMHMDIIRKNGFTLEEDVHAPPGCQFKLKAVPFSKNITFGAEDFKELISTLADSQGECSMISSYKMDTSDSVCPSRVRAMLASRACRSSVMIGDPLGRNEMKKILEHLADLKSPWNCPHGRPTMRHLIDLTTVRKR